MSQVPPERPAGRPVVRVNRPPGGQAPGQGRSGGPSGRPLVPVRSDGSSGLVRSGGPPKRPGAHRPAHRRRRRPWTPAQGWAILGTLAVLLGFIAWTGLSRGGSSNDPIKRPDNTTIGSHSPPSTVARTTTTRPAPTTTTIPPPSLVSSQTFGTFVPTITNPANGASLPTQVLYPTNASGSPLAGRHPLIVFAPGFDAQVSWYAALLSTWAKAGFVVAAPSFPNTSYGSSPLVESDYQYEPGDVGAVIRALLSLDSSPNNVLQGIIDPRAIGLAGHSDGGDVMSAVAYDSYYAYPRIGAVAILSGAQLPNASGTYWSVPDPPPLLVVQGLDDPALNPPAYSQQLYQSDPGLRYYLQLAGGTHWTPYSLNPMALTAFPTGISPGDLAEIAAKELPVTEKVTTDFFSAELAPGSGVKSSQIISDGMVAGVATISAAG